MSAAGAARSEPLRQMVGLFRMELLLLARNRAATLLVGLLPLGIAYVRLRGYEVAAVGTTAAVTQMASVLGMIPVLFIHHHLVTVYATRRQELVLKRLRAGLPSERTILAGAASATAVLCVGQTLLFATYGMAVLGLPAPANPLQVLLAILLLAALMTTFSALMSAVTRSSESAMVTTVPTLGVFLATPGILVPFGTLPPPVEQAAWFSPVGPFAQLVRTGWLGHESGETTVSVLGGLVDAVSGLAVMSAWLVLSLMLTERFFRWEPRHG